MPAYRHQPTDLILEAGSNVRRHHVASLVDRPRIGADSATSGFNWRPTLLIVAIIAALMIAVAVLQAV
jgi:hypothetical protein